MLSVAAREVSPPWRTRTGTRVRVPWQGDLTPDPGVLAAYQRIFPHRYVRWHREHQWWEIRHRNPVTGHDEHVAFLTILVQDPEGRSVPHYRPFDAAFVALAAQDAWQWRRASTLEAYFEARDARAEGQRATRWRHLANDIAAEIGEIRRLLPTISGDGKIPLVPGADLITPA